MKCAFHVKFKKKSSFSSEHTRSGSRTHHVEASFIMSQCFMHTHTRTWQKSIFSFCISLFSIISYFLYDKSIALLFQVIISILLIINWQRVFKDWLFILYPIFGIFFTTFFGTRLSISGDQFWHLLIGPSGTISVLTFYLVLKRSDTKFT